MRVATERALAFAEPLASVDSLVEALRAREDGGLALAQMLAAAGRYGEARDALATARPPEDHRQPLDRIAKRSYRRSRVAYQLARWIDSGGDVALLPPAPPPRASASEEGSSAGNLRELLAEQAAIRATRRAVADHDRGAARAALRDELSARRLIKSPRWIEDTLDHLWDTGIAERRLLTGGLKAVLRAGLSRSELGRLAMSMTLDGLPGLEPPAWLEPPEHALYELPWAGRWTAVALDSDAGEWLEEVWARENVALSAYLGHLEAWLTRENGSVVVHLGERRVGTIPPDALESFTDAIEDAEFREELVFGRARLTKRDAEPRFILELVTPAAAARRPAPA